jgi:hypothetical protein
MSVFLILNASVVTIGQPRAISGGIEFKYCGDAKSVELVGDFN